MAIKFSMKNLRLMEDIVDERITQTFEILRQKFAFTGEEVDLSDWIRYVCSTDQKY